MFSLALKSIIRSKQLSSFTCFFRPFAHVEANLLNIRTVIKKILKNIHPDRVQLTEYKLINQECVQKINAIVDSLKSNSFSSLPQKTALKCYILPKQEEDSSVPVYKKKVFSISLPDMRRMKDTEENRGKIMRSLYLRFLTFQYLIENKPLRDVQEVSSLLENKNIMSDVSAFEDILGGDDQLDFDQLREALKHRSKEHKKKQVSTHGLSREDYLNYFRSKNIPIWHKGQDRNPLQRHFQKEMDRDLAENAKMRGSFTRPRLREIEEDPLIPRFMFNGSVMVKNIATKREEKEAVQRLRQFLIKWRGHLNFNARAFQKQVFFLIDGHFRGGLRAAKKDRGGKVTFTKKHVYVVTVHVLFDEYKLFAEMKAHIPFVDTNSMIYEKFADDL